MGPNAVFSIGRMRCCLLRGRVLGLTRRSDPARRHPHLRQDLPGCLRMPCKCALVGLDSGADGGGCNRTASAEAKAGLPSPSSSPTCVLRTARGKHAIRRRYAQRPYPTAHVDALPMLPSGGTKGPSQPRTDIALGEDWIACGKTMLHSSDTPASTHHQF